MGRAPVDADVPTSPTTRGRSAPGALFFCVRGRSARTATTSRRRPSRAARSRSSSSARSTCPCRSSSSQTRRAAMAVAADEFFGHPTRELAGRRRHRHERQDDDAPSCSTRCSRRRAAARACSARSRRASAASGGRPCARRPRRSTSSARSARCSTRATAAARSRRPRTAPSSRRLDGVRFAALVFTNLTPGPPRLPRDDGALLRGQAAAVRRGRGRRPRSTSATSGAGGSPPSSPGRARRTASPPDAELGPDALDGDRLCSLRGPVQRRERARPRSPRRACSASTTRRSQRGLESVRGRAGPLRARRRGPAVRRSSSTTRTRPTRSRTCSARRASSARGRVICVFGCGGDRDRGKRPLMGRIAAELADVAIVTSDNPRSEDPRAIIDEIARRRARRARGRARPPRARSRGRSSRREPGDVVVIAGKGHEQGQEFADGRAAVRRPRGRARGAAPARSRALIPLTLDEVERARSGPPEPRRPGRTRSPASRSTRAASSEGDLFVAVGAGADFVKHALARGAAATLVPDDAFAALAALGRRRPRAQRARASSAITGSTGKTSTKDILAALCAPQRAHRRRGGELQQRARRAAHALPDRARHRGLRSSSSSMRGLGQIAALARVRAARRSA